MDEPLRGRLRPARRRGLTSPDPVTAPHGPSGHPADRQPDPRQGPVDKPQKCERQESHARRHHQDHVSWIHQQNAVTQIRAVDRG